MARPKKSAIGIQPAQGKRKTFDEDASENEDFPIAGPSSQPAGDEWEDYSDEDEDDAPEAVSVGAAKKGLRSRDEEIASTQKSKQQAAAARSKAIADAKAAGRSSEKKVVNKPNPAGTKRKAKSADDATPAREDADAARLRKRMEAAMAAGDDESDSEDGEGEGGSEEEGESFHSDSEEEGGEGSFHTDSEEEEGSEEEEDAESDSSETLKDGPISDKERSLRAQMQAMMEAAEARSGFSVPAKAKAAGAKSEEVKAVKSALKKGSKRPVEVEEEEENFDLAPLSYGRPLSAKVLRAAVEEEESRKERQAELERIERAKAKELKQDKRKRRKMDDQPTVRQIANGKHLQLLEPELSAPGSGLPPIMPARSTKPAGAQSRSKFFKTAMKSSGMIPGKGLGDGRKRAVAS